MRKNIKNTIIAAMALLAAVSCVDDRNNFMVDDSFGFNNAVNENVLTLPIYGGAHDLTVIKSGKGTAEGVVNLTSSNADLLEYNKEMGTDYIPVPADLYTFGTSSLSFKAEEVSKNITITWDVAKVAEYMETEPANDYCIPVSLRSEGLEVNEGRHLFVINLVKSTITAEQTLLSKTIEWESEASEETMNINVNIDKAIPGLDLGIDFEVDNTLIASYNEANGTDYEAAPEGLITLGADPILKAGTKETLLPVTLNTAVLVDPATGLIKTDWNGYVVPIKLNSMTIDGVKVNNGVTFFVLKGIRPVPPQLFNRLWGIYATSATAPWQATFSLSDVRNITMDDEYIYIPQTAGGDPVLKAVSITDPTKVKAVNVEGVAGGTHTLSCVRMIPNSDPAVNNGKDLLVATNLTLGDGSHLHYYVWLNGIDAAPVKYMVDDSGRRMGDKFIIVGSWKNGEVYAKDYNTGNIIRNALVDTGIGEWPGADGLAYARGRFDYSGTVADAAGCIGSAYVYPGTEKAGSDVPSGFLVTSTASGHYLTNTSGNIFASSSDLGLKMTHGYSFFSDALTSNKYIAYVAIEADQAHGSVKVISDFEGTPAGFETVLKTNKVVFEAPIQDAMDATVVSACPATHSTGDCVVRTVGDKTYMAVMIQNVGISVFELNAGFLVD